MDGPSWEEPPWKSLALPGTAWMPVPEGAAGDDSYSSTDGHAITFHQNTRKLPIDWLNSASTSMGLNV